MVGHNIPSAPFVDKRPSHKATYRYQPPKFLEARLWTARGRIEGSRFTSALPTTRQVAGGMRRKQEAVTQDLFARARRIPHVRLHCLAARCDTIRPHDYLLWLRGVMF
jgi:hypothetical protein